MKTTQRLLLIFTVVLVSSCSVITDQEMVEEWNTMFKGKPIIDFIQWAKRSPARTINLPDGSFIYIWSEDTSYTTSVNCTQNIYGTTHCTGGDYISRSCEVSAFVGTEGLITGFNVSGCTHFKTGSFNHR